MLNKSLFIRPSSGFVPFAGTAGSERRSESRDAVLAIDSDVHWAAQVDSRAGWEAPASVGARRVELMMLAGICGYFTFGLGGLLGLY